MLCFAMPLLTEVHLIDNRCCVFAMPLLTEDRLIDVVFLQCPCLNRLLNPFNHRTEVFFQRSRPQIRNTKSSMYVNIFAFNKGEFLVLAHLLVRKKILDKGYP